MTTLKTKETLLSTDLKLRTPAWADVNAVAKLIYDVCEADGDTSVAASAEEMEHEWREEGFTLETDAFVVETSDRQIVGYIELFNEKDHAHLNTDMYVHPAFKERGIGETLLARIEQRAREEIARAASDLRVYIHSSMDNKDEAGKSLHLRMGFTPVRYHWRMEIKLDSPPAPVVLPNGIELRLFDREAHARLVWQATNESFSEHWGSHDSTFEQWCFWRFDKSDFDPTLWMIAWDGDEIAGFSQNRFRMGIGWIGTLGVRKPWRKLGLGQALLLHSFGEFYKRGIATIGLGVDASNSTGATRLYERVGMYVASEFITLEKELRPGRDLEDASARG